MGRLVAIKILRSDDHIDTARLMVESRAIAKVKSPYVVAIHSVSSNPPYLELEYVNGGTLAEKLKKEGPLPPKKAARLVEELAKGVGAVHGQADAIHRDLKPGNVLLEKNGKDIVPKITDFGLAKFYKENSNRTCAGQILGTPAYMAPEQARSEPVAPVTDVYGLGAILYECLTGRLPFQGSTPLLTLAKVQSEKPTPPRKIRPELSPILEAICLNCLEKKRDERYGSADALASDLSNWQNNKPTKVKPGNIYERVIMLVQRNWKWLAPVAAIVFLLLISGLTTVVGLYFYGQLEKRKALAAATQARINEHSAEKISQAHQKQKTIHDLLAKRGGVFQLLNKPVDWRQAIANARADLNHARDLQKESGISPSKTIMKRIDSLTQQLKRDDQDRLLATKLQKIRINRLSIIAGNKLNYAKAVEQYRDTLGNAGIYVGKKKLLQSIAVISNSKIHEQLIAALDDFAISSWNADQDELGNSVFELARLADNDDFRKRLRDPAIYRNRKNIAAETNKLYKDATRMRRQAPQTLDLVGSILHRHNLDSERWFRTAQAIYPKDSSLNLKLGLVVSDNNPTEAIGFYRAVNSIQSNSAAWNNIGTAESSRKNYEWAIGAYDKALEIDPQHANALYNRANAVHELWKQNPRAKKYLVAAIADYEKAIGINPTIALYWHNLGLARYDDKNYRGAISAYSKAIDIEPNLAMSWNNRGNAKEDLNDLTGAIADFNRACQLDVNYRKPYFNLGRVLRQQGKIDRASECFQKAIELSRRKDSTRRDALQELSVCRLLLLKRQEKPQSINKNEAGVGIGGKLGSADALDFHPKTVNCRRDAYSVRFKAGSRYQIDLTSDDFDTLLRIEDNAFKILLSNDDISPPLDRNSRLVFTAPQEGDYRVVVTSFADRATGRYDLKIREVIELGKPIIVQGDLGKSAKTRNGRFYHIHNFKLEANRPYTIQLEGKKLLDTYLKLRDGSGNSTLVENDDISPGIVNVSRIDFTPCKSTIYSIVVTSYQSGEKGHYTLKIQGYGPSK